MYIISNNERGNWCSMGGWEFQGDGCSRGMGVLGDGCLGGWEFLIRSKNM